MIQLEWMYLLSQPYYIYIYITTLVYIVLAIFTKWILLRISFVFNSAELMLDFSAKALMYLYYCYFDVINKNKSKHCY